MMRIGQQEQLIPSASSISSSKAFRERARQSGVPSTAPSTGFISLSLLPSSAIPKKESRLANSSDEEDGEDGIEGLSMPIGRKANKKAAEEMKKGLRELIDEGEAELEMGGPSTAAGREEEEEAREWEEAQIKRGEGRRFVPPPASSNGPSKPTSIPIPRPLPPLTSLLSTLSLQLTNLKAQHANDELAVEQFEKEKGVLAEQELELRGEVERVGRMSAFFGGMAKGGEGMRPWVEEMGNFLEAKVRLASLRWHSRLTDNFPVPDARRGGKGGAGHHARSLHFEPARTLRVRLGCAFAPPGRGRPLDSTSTTRRRRA